MTNKVKKNKDKKNKKGKDKAEKKVKKAAGGGRGRQSKYTDDMVIKIIAEGSPHREGSPGAKAFALMKNGMTIGKFLKQKEAHRKFIRRDVRAGNIKVKAPK